MEESNSDHNAQNHRLQSDRNHQQQQQQHQQQQQQQQRHAMKKSSSRSSDSSAHPDSPHSPLRYHTPHRSELGDPADSTPYASPVAYLDKPPLDNSKAIVAVDKYTQFSPPSSDARKSRLESVNNKPPPRQKAVEAANRPAKAEEEGRVARSATKIDVNGEEEAEGGSPAVETILWRSRSKEMVKRAALGFRVSEVIICLISFSVMAADKTQGWSGDSFDRYREYRFCLSVNILGFVYSGFQAYDLAYHFITEKHVIRHYFRCHFDFFMDQILAYLLLSASSAAATQVIDWETNWGKDEFTKMASASIAMAFLAFVSFASSSLISGYNLCTRDSA